MAGRSCRARRDRGGVLRAGCQRRSRRLSNRFVDKCRGAGPSIGGPAPAGGDDCYIHRHSERVLGANTAIGVAPEKRENRPCRPSGRSGSRAAPTGIMRKKRPTPDRGCIAHRTGAMPDADFREHLSLLKNPSTPLPTPVRGLKNPAIAVFWP